MENFHIKFQFEDTIEKMITEEDPKANPEDFVSQLNELGAGGGQIATLLLAVTEYSNFIALMKSYKAE